VVITEAGAKYIRRVCINFILPVIFMVDDQLRKMRWVVHVVYKGEMINAYKILDRNLEEKETDLEN
jgi:hypothetical protein